MGRIYLQSVIGKNVPVCTAKPKSPKETRTVASCLVDGKDIGREMVKSGWALDYKHFSKGEYLGIDYHQMRKLLQSEGYDGIFLLKEQTVSAIVPSSITVKQEHDAVPFYIDLVRPGLVARFGKDPLLAP